MKVPVWMRLAVVVALASSVHGASPLTAQSRDATTPAPQAAPGTLSVTGHVVLNEGTPAPPVRRARVTLTTDGALPAQVTDTDTDGFFRFDKLRAGAFRILVEKPGFVLVEQRPGRGAIRPLSFTLDATEPVPLTIQMQRAAALEGQVLGDKGEPAANVVVSAVRLAYGPYGRRPAAVRQATTDDLGRFRVHTLPSGDYYLEAAPDPLYGVTTSLPADHLGYARSYYPGTPRVDEARVVTLAPSQELSNLDFRISSVRLSSVSGTVVDAAGRPATTASFRMQRPGAPPGEVRGFSARGGEFQFPAVPPGDYWLLASTRPAGADVEYGAMRVTVAGEDLKGLTVSTVKGTAVAGRVEAEGSAAVPPNLLVVAAETEFDVPAPPSSPPSSLVPGTVGADGTFSFAGLIGNRLFRIDRLPAGWALKSVLMDGADATDVPVDVGASSQPRTLRLVITNRTASVSGSLEGPAGGPATGRVIVFSDDPRRWGWRSRLIKSVEVQADGRYAVTGLPAGRYYIVGVDEIDDGAWLDPEVLGRLQATATPLTLTEGQRISLMLARR